MGVVCGMPLFVFWGTDHASGEKTAGYIHSSCGAVHISLGSSGESGKEIKLKNMILNVIIWLNKA